MVRFANTLGAALVALSALPALAATITVTNGSDNATTPAAGSLRDAVSKANAGDTIEIAAGVTVKLTADIDVPAAKGNITIQGKNPTDGVSGKPSTIAPEKAGQDPAPTIKLSGNGDTIQHVICDGVTVSSKSTTGVKVSGCEFKGVGSGVRLESTTGAQIGTDADGNKGESNSFVGCRSAVTLQQTTDTTVAHCDFRKTGLAVTGADDTNIRVTENTIVGKAATKIASGDGVLVFGASGTIDKNTITPDSTGGTGIGVTNSTGGGSKGALNVTGNDVKVKGKAKGIDVTGRKDVTISAATVEGKSSAPGIHCSIGPDAGTGGTLVVDGCTVKGCTPGISCDMTAASDETCTISNNTVSDCKFDGIDCMAGADGSCSLTGNKLLRCGSGPTGCGLRVGGAGGALSANDNVVTSSKGAGVWLRLSQPSAPPTICRFESMTLALSKGPGMFVEHGAAAIVMSATFQQNARAAVFVDVGGSFGTTPTVFDAVFDPAAHGPAVDFAPSGWGSSGVSAQFDTAGNLTVTVPAGVTQVALFGKGPSVHRAVSGSAVTLSAGDLPEGAGGGGDYLAIYAFEDGSDAIPTLRGETRVRFPRAKPSGGGAKPFHFSRTSFTLTATVGNDVTQELDVTNVTAQPLTLVIQPLTKDLFNSPNGDVLFMPNETKAVLVGGSSMQAGTEHGTFKATLPDGTLEETFNVTLVVKE